MFKGSIAFLIDRIISTVPSPSSSVKYFFFPTPTPCSPEPMQETRRENKKVSLVHIAGAQTYMSHREQGRDGRDDEWHL
jgi:hypothetical protein